MTPAAPAPDEARRLEVLRDYHLLDTPAEEVLDEITQLAAHICEMPIGLISLIDAERQWFKSNIGLPAHETPRSLAFCAHTILQRDLVTIPDATLDPRFAGNPLVTAEPHLRAYAAVPIVSPEGHALGTLCVLDRQPRQLTPIQLETLRVLGRQVMAQLDLRRHIRHLRESEERSRAVIEGALDAIITIDHENRITAFNAAAERTFGWSREEVMGRDMAEVIIPERSREGHRRGVARYLATEQPRALDRRLDLIALRRDGTEFPVELTATRLGGSKPARFAGFIRDTTDLRRAEQSLRASEKRLRDLIDGLGPSMFVALLNKQGEVLEVNQPALDVAGLKLSDVLGRPFAELPPWERNAALQQQFRAAIERAAAGEASRFDVAMRGHGGEPVFLDFCLQPRRDEHGEVAFLVPSANVITERKRAEEERAAAAARDEALVRALGQIVYDRRPRTGQLTWEGAYTSVLGYSPEEMGCTTESWTSRVHPDDLAGVQAGEKEAARQGRAFQLDYRFLHRDGAYRQMHDSGVLFLDDRGRVVRIIGVLSDISERHRIERRLRRLIESNAQGILFFSRSGGIMDANDAFLRMLGYSREDLAAGRLDWKKLTPPEYDDLDRRALEELTATGVCTAYEKQYLRRDGSRVPVLIGGSAFEDNSEEGVAFVVDLTDSKKLEQQFLRAQRIEGIGTLAGGIAHDLNNVLGPIITSLDLLQMRFPDRESRELIAIIAGSAQRGADMVRQVLSFARGVEGRRIEVQIKHLLQEMEKIINETFLKHIQVRLVFPHDLWTVMGDPTQLHQVLLNLCVNARDAMPGGGTLTLSAENVALDDTYAALHVDLRPGAYVFVQVEDTGIGMSPEIAERIFDPFFTTKEPGQGTGLGLSTSLAIVKSHGGALRVYSEAGKGTQFKIYLPAQTVRSPALLAAVAAEMPHGSGQLILVVDDEAAIRLITQQTLETHSYRVVVAKDGAEALAIFAARRAEIAAILTDMMMPVMDGAATIQVLRKMGATVPIIAASGFAANGQSAYVATLGVQHFLPKPYTAEAVLKVLQKALAPAAQEGA